eukprot:gene13072-8918_t
MILLIILCLRGVFFVDFCAGICSYGGLLRGLHVSFAFIYYVVCIGNLRFLFVMVLSLRFAGQVYIQLFLSLQFLKVLLFEWGVFIDFGKMLPVDFDCLDLCLASLVYVDGFASDGWFRWFVINCRRFCNETYKVYVCCFIAAVGRYADKRLLTGIEGELTTGLLLMNRLKATCVVCFWDFGDVIYVHVCLRYLSWIVTVLNAVNLNRFHILVYDVVLFLSDYVLDSGLAFLAVTIVVAKGSVFALRVLIILDYLIRISFDAHVTLWFTYAVVVLVDFTNFNIFNFCLQISLLYTGRADFLSFDVVIYDLWLETAIGWVGLLHMCIDSLSFVSAIVFALVRMFDVPLLNVGVRVRAWMRIYKFAFTLVVSVLYVNMIHVDLDVVLAFCCFVGQQPCGVLFTTCVELCMNAECVTLIVIVVEFILLLRVYSVFENPMFGACCVGLQRC